MARVARDDPPDQRRRHHAPHHGRARPLTSADSGAELVAPPERGRTYADERKVRLGDVTASGRLRLDAVARYLQDVAGDDVDDAGITGPWVVRRLTLRVERLPRFGERVRLVTFCSGTGAAWAARRTTLTVAGQVAVESVAVWVYVRPDTGRPAPLEEWFYGLYGEAAAGRTVSGRLRLPGPPPEAPPPRRWPLRVSDVDVLGHVNNAAHWEAVEEEVARCAPGGRVVAAELEHRAAVDPGERVDLVTIAGESALSVWLSVRGEVRTAARLVLSGDGRR